MKYYIAIIVYLLVLLAQGAVAQDAGYVYKPKPQPMVNDDSFKSPNCNRPKTLDQLIGEKVVFTAKIKRLQRFGYSSIYWAHDNSVSVPYEALVGKVGTITEVQPRQPGTLNFRRVVIKLETSDQSVITKALNESISDVTLLSDIEDGRKRWIGKTLWYKSKYLRPSTDAEVSEWQTVKKFQPVIVTDVLVGEGSRGIDFVLKFKDGLEGLARVGLSSSNTNPEFLETLKKLGKKECSFDAFFFTHDPRLEYKWPAEVWTALENDQVIVGMTIDQVKLAWGSPKKINVTRTDLSDSSQWVYDNNRYVYMNGSGKVTAIQE